MSLSSYLDFATTAAWAAGQSTLAHFQTGVAVEHKADRSPVTIADRGAERMLRELIAARFPEHVVLGEEYGQDDRRSSHRWVLDPIDGTQSFIRGVPLFGVLVGLEIEGVPRVGVCHFPALKETFAAASGLGCWWNGRRAYVSATARLADAAVGYSDSRMLADRLGAGLAGAAPGGSPAAWLGRLLRSLPGGERTHRRDARPRHEPVGLLRPRSDSAGGRRRLHRLDGSGPHRRRGRIQHQRNAARGGASADLGGRAGRGALFLGGGRWAVGGGGLWQIGEPASAPPVLEASPTAYRPPPVSPLVPPTANRVR